MDPVPFSPEKFRHLCRSSPWKWQTLRFELHLRPAAAAPEAAEHVASEPAAAQTVSAPAGAGQAARHAAGQATDHGGLLCWLRRPTALRVEALDGTLLHSTTRINDSKDGLFISGNRKPWMLPPYLVQPVYDDDGLVTRRPEAAYGEPAFGSPRFAALLDPVELAGKAPVPRDFPFANVAEINDLAIVDHYGRPAVEAVLSANGTYRPLDASAPLLYPGRTAIRIDLGTAVCVASQSLDGETSGAGHWMQIRGVDEYMLDDLFEEVSMGLTDVRQHIPWNVGPSGP